MIGTLLDPNMCLSGPIRPFGGPKTDQILIFGPKKVCFEFGGLNVAKLIYTLYRLLICFPPSGLHRPLAGDKGGPGPGGDQGAGGEQGAGEGGTHRVLLQD